jgi:hypothetical protein
VVQDGSPVFCGVVAGFAVTAGGGLVGAAAAGAALPDAPAAGLGASVGLRLLLAPVGAWLACWAWTLASLASRMALSRAWVMAGFSCGGGRTVFSCPKMIAACRHAWSQGGGGAPPPPPPPPPALAARAGLADGVFQLQPEKLLAPPRTPMAQSGL